MIIGVVLDALSGCINQYFLSILHSIHSIHSQKYISIHSIHSILSILSIHNKPSLLSFYANLSFPPNVCYALLLD